MKLLFNKRSNEECVHILRICQQVLGRFDIQFDIDHIQSKARKPDLVFIRALISVYLKKRKMSLTDIGFVLGERTHSTIINLLNYGRSKTSYARNSRWKSISKRITGSITEFEIQEKIKWHKKQ